MDPSIGDLFEQALFRIFKEHPPYAVAISAFILLLILGVFIINAESPDDLVFPVFLLIFAFIVIAGRLRQSSVQNLQDLQETPLIEEEAPLAQTIEQFQPQPKIVDEPQISEEDTRPTPIYKGLLGEPITRQAASKYRWRISIVSVVLGYYLGFSLLLLFQGAVSSWLGASPDDLLIKDLLGPIGFVVNIIFGLPFAILAGWIYGGVVGYPFVVKNPSSRARFVLLFFGGLPFGLIACPLCQFIILLGAAL